MKSELIAILSSAVCAVVVATTPADAMMRTPSCDPGANEFCTTLNDCNNWEAQTICESIMVHQLGCGGAIYDSGECELDYGNCQSGWKIKCYWSPLG